MENLKSFISEDDFSRQAHKCIGTGKHIIHAGAPTPDIAKEYLAVCILEIRP